MTMKAPSEGEAAAISAAAASGRGKPGIIYTLGSVAALLVCSGTVYMIASQYLELFTLSSR